MARKPIDITGQKFGRLTAISINADIKAQSTVWCCKCDCGNYINAEIRSLRSGNIKSCGCLNREVASKKANTALHKIDGTMIEMLKTKKIPANNTSGVKGVSWDKQKQKWAAYIRFKGKLYKLGHYKDLDDAAKARKAAEEQLHDEFVKWYENKY